MVVAHRAGSGGASPRESPPAAPRAARACAAETLSAAPGGIPSTAAFRLESRALAETCQWRCPRQGALGVCEFRRCSQPQALGDAGAAQVPVGGYFARAAGRGAPRRRAIYRRWAHRGDLQERCGEAPACRCVISWHRAKGAVLFPRSPRPGRHCRRPSAAASAAAAAAAVIFPPPPLPPVRRFACAPHTNCSPCWPTPRTSAAAAFRTSYACRSLVVSASARAT